MRLGPLTLDGQLVAILGALVVLESLKRVPAGATVLRRALGASWRAAPPRDEAHLTVTGPFSPFVSAVIAPGSDAGAGRAMVEGVRGRLGKARRWIVALEVLGALILLLLLIGVPAAAGNFSALVFLGAVGTLLLAGLVNATLASVAWRRVSGMRAPWLRRLAWAWPFSASTAAQGVRQEALRGADAVVAARVLLKEEAFRAWVRRRAFDHLEGAKDPALVGVLDEREMREIIEASPPDAYAAAAYCRRCGSSFARAEGTCGECALPLVPIAR